MKKLKSSKVWTLLGVFIMLMPMLLSLGASSISADESNEATVTLHKKQMDKFPESLIQNTGKKMDDFESYKGLPGVEFKFYDVTKVIYEEVDKGTSLEKAIDEIKDNPTSGELVTIDTTETGKKTDKNGDLTVSLPKVSAGKDAIYVIVETPQPGVKVAENMVLSFPVYPEGSKEELTEIHLYPKNVINLGSISILKTDEKGNSLSGAEFTLQYKDGKEASFKNQYAIPNDFETTGFLKFTDTEKAFKTGDDGTLTIIGLYDGTYTLTETKAPEGSRLSSKNTFEFTIKNGKFEGENLKYDVNGKSENNKAGETNLTIANQRIGGIHFEKKDQNTGEALKGAEFNIYKDENKSEVLCKKDGKYYFSKDVTDANLVVLTSDENGRFEIDGLDYGTYYLQETKAPEGYVLPKESTPFEIKEEVGKTEAEGKGKVILNRQKGHLPGTGGNGVIYIFVIGAMLVAGAGIYFVKRNKIS